MNRILPPRLRAGDTIGICAPAYRMDPEPCHRAAQALTDMGFRVREAPHLYSDALGFAGTREERAEDFNLLLRDPDVRMLLFSGGEVSNEILPFIDYDAAARDPKILLSYSDGTTPLEAVRWKSGLVTFYGQSPGDIGERSPYGIRCFRARLTEPSLSYEKNSEWRIITPGEAEGELLGGYLVNFAAMCGGTYLPFDRSRRYILFIEDHEMFCSPAMVSKWFTHIEQTGLMSCVSGLLFGHYSQKEYPEIDRILRLIGERFRIPVIRCEDFGHGVNHAVLPIGVRARLSPDGLEFLEIGVE